MEGVRKLRLAVFRSVITGDGDVKAIAKAERKTQKAVKAVVDELRAEGIRPASAEISTAQAAWVLGVIERRVRDFCRTGRLGRQVGGRYIIPVGDLLRFAAIPRPTGGQGAKALAELRAGKGD